MAGRKANLPLSFPVRSGMQEDEVCMKAGLAALILWGVAPVAMPAVAAEREERPKTYEIPETIEPSAEVVGGRVAIEALVGNTVLIRSPDSRTLYLRPDGTGVSQDAGPPRKREEIKWAISDTERLCIIGVNEEKMPDGASCLSIALSGDEISIWLPITGPDDAGAALLLEGELVRDNPLNL